MIRWFKRPPAAAAPDLAALGQGAVALRMPAGALVPHGCVGVDVDKAGVTRRVNQGARLGQDAAFCFHPGPYSTDLTPFAAAPELGLHLRFAINDPDPRVPQQRFDLYLASEAGEGVMLSDFGAAIESALQRELAQGNLDLPPCTSVDEWNAFRAGLNQLLYQRFGISVDDCIPVDLGERIDYAQLLLARAIAAPALPADAAREIAVPADSAMSDARALRRLFLELPGVTSALRLVALPPGQALFRQHQSLLQRLDHVGLLMVTMPALELAAPGQPLPAERQAVRAQHSRSAVIALDEAWALAARLANTSQLAACFDDAERIVANLEYHAAGRRDTA